MTTRLEPVSPGEILQEEYLSPLGISASAFAQRLGVPTNRVTRLLRGETRVTADTALRLGRALSTTPQFWLNLQAQFDLAEVQDADIDLSHITPVTAA